MLGFYSFHKTPTPSRHPHSVVGPRQQSTERPPQPPGSAVPLPPLEDGEFQNAVFLLAACAEKAALLSVPTASCRLHSQTLKTRLRLREIRVSKGIRLHLTCMEPDLGDMSKAKRDQGLQGIRTAPHSLSGLQPHNGTTVELSNLGRNKAQKVLVCGPSLISIHVTVSSSLMVEQLTTMTPVQPPNRPERGQ